MGQAAKANAAQREAWISTLNGDENIARIAAENLLRWFIIPAKSTGMCYRMTYFLHLYLTERGVNSEPVVGWITDGRDDIPMSHAWVEVSGKKIDLTLGIVESASVNVVGEVLILDRPVTPGVKYSYFVEKEPKHLEADAVIENYGGESRALLAQKNDEHEEMKKRATDQKMIRAWLDSAPDGWTYVRLKAAIEGRDPRWAQPSRPSRAFLASNRSNAGSSSPSLPRSKASRTISLGGVG